MRTQSSATARVRLALIAAGALGLLVLTAPASAGARGEFIGVNGGAPLDQPDLQKISDTGVRTDRFVLSWASIERTKGNIDWAATDRVVGGSASRGIRPAPMVWGSPRWVASKPAHPPIDSKSARRAWKSFLEAAVNRYGAGGTYWSGAYRHQYPGAKPLPINAWQVWTEPNGKSYFLPTPSAQRYATLLRISHDAIKGASRSARVVLGGLVGLRKWHGQRLKGVAGWEFLRHLYRIRGIKREFDVVAIHPYAPNLDELRKEMKRFRAAMRKGGDKRTYLWITELGWGSAPRGSGNSVLGLNKGLNGQRKLLAGAFKLISHHRSSWRVARLFWYDWRDRAKGAHSPCSFCESSGLLRHDRTPKPSYRAFKHYAKK
jgi:hypothetical protein